MKRSKVTIEDAVYVHIHGRKKVTGGRFELAEDKLLHDFLLWLIEHPEIPSLPLGSSGLGSYTGYFPAEFRPQIESFFKEKRYVR